MRRVVLTLTVLSALLCMGVVAACIRGNVAGDEVLARWMDKGNGRVLCLYALGSEVGVTLDIEDEALGREDQEEKIELYGLYVAKVSDTSGYGYIVFAAYWVLIPITAALPAIILRRTLLARQRRKHGLCSACGYDLRESKERCPECGTPVPPRPSPSSR